MFNRNVDYHGTVHGVTASFDTMVEPVSVILNWTDIMLSVNIKIMFWVVWGSLLLVK